VDRQIHRKLKWDRIQECPAFRIFFHSFYRVRVTRRLKWTMAHRSYCSKRVTAQVLWQHPWRCTCSGYNHDFHLRYFGSTAVPSLNFHTRIHLFWERKHLETTKQLDRWKIPSFSSCYVRESWLNVIKVILDERSNSFRDQPCSSVNPWRWGWLRWHDNRLGGGRRSAKECFTSLKNSQPTFQESHLCANLLLLWFNQNLSSENVENEVWK